MDNDVGSYVLIFFTVSAYVAPVSVTTALQWRHNGRDGISNHQPHHCLLKRLFTRRSKKASTLRVTGLFEGSSPVAGEFPAQRTSNAENVSIWWRHHATYIDKPTLVDDNKPLPGQMLTKIYVYISLQAWIKYVNSLRPRQNRRHLQTAFSNAISWMKMFEFRLKFHWSLFLKVQLTIFQHWFR